MLLRSKKITLSNDFHNTEITVIPLVTGYLSPNQVKKIEKTLCRFSGCTCGTHGINMRNGKWVADKDFEDGSAMITKR